ncbi:hypothetical protein [Vibrio phage PhiImVa-1]|nr:hypothetical protein [Vibrio phage PhiImVa-1]
MILIPILKNKAEPKRHTPITNYRGEALQIIGKRFILAGVRWGKTIIAQFEPMNKDDNSWYWSMY